MAVNRLKYSQKLDEELKKGRGLKEAQATATKYATTTKKNIPKKKRKRIKPDYLKAAKRTLQMLWYGPKYYDKVMRGRK